MISYTSNIERAMNTKTLWDGFPYSEAVMFTDSRISTGLSELCIKKTGRWVSLLGALARLTNICSEILSGLIVVLVL